jgi:hypothetical protein
LKIREFVGWAVIAIRAMDTIHDPQVSHQRRLVEPSRFNVR